MAFRGKGTVYARWQIKTK